MPTEIKYAIIIDTDSFAGNFDSLLCAYVTGLLGESGGERDIAIKARKELGKHFEWFYKYHARQTDEYGQERPEALEPTPGYFNDGMGNAYKKGFSPELVYSNYVKAVEDYYLPHITQAINHPEGTESDIRRMRQIIKDAKKNGPGHEPSYQSIIMFFERKPNTALMKIVRERAEAYAKDPGDKYIRPFKIIGVRLIKRKITTETIDEEL